MWASPKENLDALARRTGMLLLWHLPTAYSSGFMNGPVECSLFFQLVPRPSVSFPTGGLAWPWLLKAHPQALGMSCPMRGLT